MTKQRFQSLFSQINNGKERKSIDFFLGVEIG